MQLSSLSLARRFVGKFRSRPGYDYEWILDVGPDGRDVQATLFAPRIVTQMLLQVSTAVVPVIEDVLVEVDDQEQSIDYVLHRVRGQHGPALQVCLQQRVQTRRVVLRLAAPVTFDLDVRLWMQKRGYPDELLIDQAMSDANRGALASARGFLHSYERYSKENPFVNDQLARLHLCDSQYADAERHALAACARGNFEVCREAYMEVQDQLPPASIERLRSLQNLARAWDVGGQHGAIMLESTQEVRLEVGSGSHVRKRREAIEIRRAAAARMLRRISYPFTSGRDGVLHSRCRVIRHTGEVEDLSDEHMTITDNQTNNPFIALEDEKELIWILPDLAPGDIVESTFDLLQGNARVDGESHPYVLLYPCHSGLPTFRSKLMVTAPTNLPIRFCTSNVDAQPKQKGRADGRDRYCMELSRCVPVKSTGFEYEDEFHNPLLIVAKSGPSWKDVSREILQKNLRDHPDAELPERLRTIMEGGHDVESKLEQCFYWIRDNIKYASMLSAKRRIGESGRAEKIVETGVGDCSDKSYLLQLVCKALDIPCTFAMVSTRSGILVEELPANQFDHVFVRAELDSREYWMDAADGSSAFGSAPAARQGLLALLLDEQGTIVTVPEDDPALNRVEITEVFSEWRNERLHGRFDLKAFGISGRMADEHFKSASLSIEGSDRAVEAALNQYLPYIIVESHARESHATHSRLFHVSGTHSRCSTARLGSEQSEVGTLVWHNPSLPIYNWRSLHIEQLFVLPVISSLHVETVLEGEALAALKDVSRIEPLDNQFCAITEELDRGESYCRIRRDLVFKKRLTRGPAFDDVIPSLKHAEKSMRMVVSLRGRR